MSKAISLTPVLTVGVTGHRKLGEDPLVRMAVHARCVTLFQHFQQQASYREMPLIAYSALAIGADQLFAQAALGLGIPLYGIIPFEDYPDDFKGPDREQFELLKSLCQEVHTMKAKRKSNLAYLRAGTWMVDQCHYLVAVWNRQPAAGKGGTGDVVQYAQKKKKDVFIIDPIAPKKCDS